MLILFLTLDLGMTNRPDLIDEALLRPGRLEVKMEIGKQASRSQHVTSHVLKIVKQVCISVNN